jgi:hypothetical protein
VKDVSDLNAKGTEQVKYIVKLLKEKFDLRDEFQLVASKWRA